MGDMEQEPIPVVMLGLAATDEVGAGDWLAGVRVVPDGREGKIVYARTLEPGEPIPEGVIELRPDLGEELRFRPGAARFGIEDVDRIAPQCPDGYRPITGTLWTWLGVERSLDQAVYRYLLAAGRRLDTAHELFREVESAREGGLGLKPSERSQAFSALGYAELMCVALSRAIDMLEGAGARFGSTIAVPDVVSTNAVGLRAIRNAFEHIEDRALGCVRGETHPDALSIFRQSRFLREGCITYGGYALNMTDDVLPMIVSARDTLLAITVEFVGPVRINSAEVRFFPTDTGA